jgi:hypothetical protein
MAGTVTVQGAADLVQAPVKSASIAVKVTKADGTVIDYGVVSYWHRNPIRRLAWRLKQLIARRVEARAYCSHE